MRISGESFGYRNSLELIEAAARGFRSLGIAPGDRVGLMCTNRPEALWTWIGANAARAIDVPFNAEARGKLLAYFVRDAEPRVLVGTKEYLQILAETIDLDPAFVVCVGDSSSKPFGDRAHQIPFDELLALGRSSSEVLDEPAPGDTATIMYTSGTTGPSKGVMVPHRYYTSKVLHAQKTMGLQAGEVSYCVQPLFHMDARAYVAVAPHVRATHAVGHRFSVTRFWDEVRDHGAAVFGTIGTMVWLLYKQPPKPDDSDQPARLAMCSSTPGDIMRDFERRFGLEISEGYGMTECLLIAGAPPGESLPGRVGRPIPELDVRLVDDADVPVDVGAIGELVYRPKGSFEMMQGYWRKPNATVEAWRNLWFHSGDLLREHADGYLEYVGRKKDAIRRRGENVSAWEVEQAVAAHPSVLEVAAIGVPSEVGEEDVAVLVVAKPDSQLDAQELVKFVSSDLPRFAVPRYVELVDNLPKTPSERIDKGTARERGITDAAWDANIALGRR